MTDQQALDEAVHRTAHERYRDYINPSHPDYDPRYWVIVRAIAEGRSYKPEPRLDPALIPVSQAFALHRLMNACQYRAHDAACGCSGHRCGLRHGRPAAIVSNRDCLECVRVYGA